MENQNMEMKSRFLTKKRVALIAAIVCCLTLAVAGTMAYFTTEETAYNVISSALLDMELHDETLEDGELVPFPDPEEGISGVMPGDVVSKVVYVENVGTADMYVRIKLENSVVGADGEKLSFEKISLNLDKENWTYNKEDGYYYYNEALTPEQSTTELFTEVKFAEEMGNEYQECTVKIDVSAQAVQSKNNGENVFEAAGWPEA